MDVIKTTEALPATAALVESARGATDSDLVRRAQAGDEDAFARIVERRLDRIYRTAAAIVGNEADAHDITQDAFVKAWQELPRLKDIDRFDAWLQRIVVNRCRDALRRRGRVREIHLDADTRASADTTDSVAEIDRISSAFDRLSVADRELLVLHHLEELTVAAIADRLGKPIGTVKWRLHNARQALERALEMER